MNVGLPPVGGNTCIVTGGPSRCVWERGAGKVPKLEEGRSSSCWRVREFSEEEWFSEEDWTLEEVWKEAQEEGSERVGEDTVHSGLGGWGWGPCKPAPTLPGLLSQAHKCGASGPQQGLLHGGWSCIPCSAWRSGHSRWAPCVRCSQPEPVHTCASHSALSTPLCGAPAPTVALGLTWHKRLSLQQTGSPAEWKHSVSEHLLSWLLDGGLSVRTGSGFPFSALKLLSWELDLEQRASMSLLIVKTH